MISDSSHLHHFPTLSLSRQMSAQTFCKKVDNDGKTVLIDITITGNVHSFSCSYIKYQKVSLIKCLKDWKRIQGDSVIIQESFCLILFIRHTFSVLSLDICQT